LPVDVVPVLPGTIPVLQWLAAERGHAGLTHHDGSTGVSAAPQPRLHAISCWPRWLTADAACAASLATEAAASTTAEAPSLATAAAVLHLDAVLFTAHVDVATALHQHENGHRREGHEGHQHLPHA
jgi:hypothetical protein